MRTAILIVALLFTTLFAALTIAAIRSGGFDILAFISLVVIGMFVFGIVGALRHPPED